MFCYVLHKVKFGHKSRYYKPEKRNDRDGKKDAIELIEAINMASKGAADKKSHKLTH